uniref:Protein kinase domain-containing protein n=1 Tax=viral metagenome TaxID=1070528 RepID=A0A6C0F779_9ZZZZ|tara:strand:- start:16630 stop:17337 length:708 start_codon:yes stop_codon:yes gene_type:complete
MVFNVHGFTQKIGQGVYGTIYRFNNKNNIYIVKVNIKRKTKQLYNERKIHIELYKTLSKKCKSFIVKPVIIQKNIIDNFKMQNKQFRKLNDNRFHVMKNIDGIELRTFLKLSPPIPVLKKVIKNIKKALLCMWTSGFIHADLHGRNILVLPNNKIKLIDFGFTTKVDKLINLSNSEIKQWFISTWPNILKSFRLNLANPNIHIYGLYNKTYPNHCNMFSEKNKDLFANAHKRLKN